MREGGREGGKGREGGREGTKGRGEREGGEREEAIKWTER